MIKCLVQVSLADCVALQLGWFKLPGRGKLQRAAFWEAPCRQGTYVPVHPSPKQIRRLDQAAGRSSFLLLREQSEGCARRS